MHSCLYRCVATALFLLPDAAALAQRPPQPRPPELAMERVVRDRWLHGGQHPRFTPFASRTDWLLIDSVRSRGADRALHMTLGRSAYGRDSAVVVTDPAGRVRQLSAAYAPFRAPEIRWPDDSSGYERMRRFPSHDRLHLAQARLWDLTPPVPAGTPRRGLRWTDTIARSALDGPYAQVLSGKRAFIIVGDTLVEGVRLWVVRDSAIVRYEERYVERERTLDTLVSIARRGSGLLRGTYLYHAELGRMKARHDTLSISGDAILRYPDGRSFRTPARLERTQEWTLHDSAQYVARRAALQRANQLQMGGMVRVSSPDDERLSRGDQALRDSLIRAWQQTSDPNDAAQIFRRLSMGRDTAFRARMDRMRIAAGDSAFHYRGLAERAYGARVAADSSAIQPMLPFMEDPGRAWALNESRDLLYENLVQALTTWPPAAAKDSADQVACTESGCRLLAAQLGAREARLRDVALTALFSMDPARWGDSVIQRTGPLHPLLRRPALVARGVGSTWSAASKEAVPPPGSDWPAWLEWMNGQDSASIVRQAQMAKRYAWAKDTTTHPRFEESHRVALRMYTRRTGRDIVSELQEGYRAASHNRARLVFGTMLHGLGALEFTDEEVIEAFASGDSTRSALARQVFMGRFHRMAKPLDSAIATPLIDRMLSVILDNAPLWSFGARDLYSNPPSSRPELHAKRGRVLVRTTGVPVSLRDKWRAKADFVAEGERMDVREGAVIYAIPPVLGMGRFAMITVNAAEQVARPAEAAPVHYASSMTFYLMRVGDEWFIVATSAWVT